MDTHANQRIQELCREHDDGTAFIVLRLVAFESFARAHAGPVMWLAAMIRYHGPIGAYTYTHRSCVLPNRIVLCRSSSYIHRHGTLLELDELFLGQLTWFRCSAMLETGLKSEATH